MAYSLHIGHRERMKRKFLQYGIDGMEEHEILEILLFYSLPRIDTNELGHILIEQFGSLAGVLNADYEELIKVPGIKENTATLLKLSLGIARKYAISSQKTEEHYDTIEKIGNYLVNMYVGVNVERVYLMLFDNSLKLLDCCWITDGTINATSLLPRVLIEKALNKHASSVVLAHNHPFGMAIPSGDDIAMTHRMDSAFELVGINMLDHIIVAGEKYASVMRRGDDMLLRASTPLKY